MEQAKESPPTGIKDIIEIGRKKQEITRQIEGMTKPTISDLNDIPHLYELFCESSPTSRNDIRLQFALAVLYLYSPASLIGGGIPFDIKVALAKLYGRSIRTIENITRNIFFLYEHHKGFRAGVDAGIEHILKRKA